MEDILLIDKPVGITSFDVIRQLRRRYRDAGLPAPKMGHAGTLDPLASGLMVLGIGKGTKRLTDLTKLDKEYEADILLGQSTTTGDREGDVTAEKTVSDVILESNIADILQTMVGELSLPVSGYSAIKVDGVPMYKRARAAAASGAMIPTVPERRMRVLSATLEGSKLVVVDQKQFQVITVRFAVGSGTYIRSLAEELGRRLGDYPAHLTALRRTTVGEFRIKEAITIETFVPKVS